MARAKKRKRRWPPVHVPPGSDHPFATLTAGHHSHSSYDWCMEDYHDLCAAVQGVKAEAEAEHSLVVKRELLSPRPDHERRSALDSSSSIVEAKMAEQQLSETDSDQNSNLEPRTGSKAPGDVALPEPSRLSSINGPPSGIPVGLHLLPSEEAHDSAPLSLTAAPQQECSTSPKNESPPGEHSTPSSVEMVTLLSPDSNPETDLQAQYTAVHATLLQTRASFAASPYVPDSASELSCFANEYKGSDEVSSSLEGELHRMHAEISFMWSVIRRARLRGIRRPRSHEASRDSTKESEEPTMNGIDESAREGLAPPRNE